MKFPEHEKLKQVQEKSQACGEFLDWLKNDKGYALKLPLTGGGSMPIHKNTQDLLADFFGINQDALEAEKQAMLAIIRMENTERELSDGV